jgi:hypothetical protein
METDTLQEFEGHWIVVELNPQVKPGSKYVGILQKYDRDFIKLSPTTRIDDQISALELGIMRQMEQNEKGTPGTELLHKNSIAHIRYVSQAEYDHAITAFKQRKAR